jgi:osmotically-inducible protein OsmY
MDLKAFVLVVLVILLFVDVSAQESIQSKRPQIQMVPPEKATMKEETLNTFLSDDEKEEFKQLDPKAKEVVLKIASIPELNKKGMALMITKELGWGPKGSENTHTKKYVASDKDKGLSVEDKVIVRKIRHSYIDHIYPVNGKSIKPENLSIVVENGHVTLIGTIPAEKQKKALISWSKLIKGVMSVDDQIKIDEN